MAVQFKSVQLSGISGLDPELRIPFDGQLLSVFGPHDDDQSLIVAALSCALDSDRVERFQRVYRNRISAGSKVRLDLESDGKSLAILRNLADGAVQFKLQAGTQTIGTGKDDDGLLHTLVDELGFSMPADWKRLFVWSLASESSAAAPALQEPQDDFGTAEVDTSALKRELQSLQEERMMLGSMGNVQDQADEMQNRLFEIEHRSSELQKVLNEGREQETFLAEKSDVIEGGTGLANRARSYEDLKARFDNQRYKHQTRRKEMEQSIKQLASNSSILDPRLIGGAVVFLGSLIGAGVTKNQYVAVPAVLALGFLAFMGYGLLKNAKARSELEEKLEEEIRKFRVAEKKYKDTVGLIEELQARYKLITPEDVAKVYEEALRTKQQYDAWCKEHDMAAMQSELDTLQAEEQGLRQKHEKLAGALREASGGYGSVKEIDIRIEQIQAKLEGRAPNLPQEDNGPTFGQRVSGALDDWTDLMQAAVKTGRAPDWSMLEPQVIEKMENFLPHFYKGRFVGVRFEMGSMLLRQQQGDDMDLAQAPESVQYLMSLLLRLGIWLSLPAERLLPIMLQDPLRSLDDDTATIAYKLLRKVGQRLSILHITSKRLLAPRGQAFELSESADSVF